MPFRFRIFDNRMFVEYAHDTSGLSRGDEVLRINDVPIQQVISQLFSYLERDGYTDHATTALLEQNFALKGASFEQFFSSAVLKRDTFVPQFDVTYKKNSEDLNVTKASMSAISFDDWIELSGRSYRLNFLDPVKVNVQGNAAVLTVDTFVNYRKPVDAFSVFEEIFSNFKMQRVTHLIVDLRNNGGGSYDAQMTLLHHLYQVPFTLVDGAWLSDKQQLHLAAKKKSTPCMKKQYH